MLDKLKIVLFKPRFIGLYIKENIFKLLITIFVAISIVSIPSFITIANKDEISGTYESYLIDATTNASIKNVYIEDYILYFDEEYEYDAYYFNIVIGKQIELESLESIYVSKFLFDYDSVRFYVSTIEVYSATYKELGVQSLDFELISTNNIVSVNKFVEIFNSVYKENHTIIGVTSYAILFLGLAFNVFGMSLVLAGISLLFSRAPNNIMPFKYRYKMCLNAQFIYLLLFLLSSLFGFDIVSYVGTFIMSLYAFMALNSITMVKKEGN